MSSDSLLGCTAWRLCHLYTIRDKAGRLVAFCPNAAQRRFFNGEHTYNHILKARQMGFSTFINLENLDAMLFCENTRCGIVDNTIDDAKRKLEMIKLAYDNLDNAEIHPDTWEVGRLIKEAVPMVATKTEIRFGNGSGIYCSSSLRGGTLQRLHISELGKTAFFTPSKAEEIRSAALNTIAPGMIINIESTHEGGRVGLHYAMLRRAMDLVGRDLTPIDPKFHFYPWHLMSEYCLEPGVGVKLRGEIRDYFAKLEAEHGIKLSEGQMLWYDRKSNQQGFAMLKEFPSTPGEAFAALVEGAIYGEAMATLRALGRVTVVPPDSCAPMYTAWDIGVSDYTAIWLVQPVGREFLWLAHYEANGKPASHYAEIVRGWESRLGRRVATHLLPHDAANRERGSAQSYVDLLAQCGMRNVVVVPRTRDVWRSIANVRKILPASWFDKDLCDCERVDDMGEPLPSGVGCLEAYHTKRVQTTGIYADVPCHDSASHTADAARTFADAWALGLLYDSSNLKRVKNTHDIWGKPNRRVRPRY